MMKGRGRTAGQVFAIESMLYGGVVYGTGTYAAGMAGFLKIHEFSKPKRYGTDQTYNASMNRTRMKVSSFA